MKTFQRILAVVIALVMSLSVIGMVAFAAEVQTSAATIDTTKTGSITVHKYEYNGTSKDTGTGEEQTPPDGSEALKDVEFTLYPVMTQEQMLNYYNGTDSSAVTVDTFVTKNADGTYTVKNLSGEIVTAGTAQTTGEDGTASFTNLALGLYVIIETKAPENVTKAADPFLVSVPMTQGSTDTNWLYDINVYPKNSTSEGNVTLKKENENGDALEGVTFKLEKKAAADPETWTQVGDQVTTTAGGEIAWNSLAFGDYRITEISAPAGYIVDQRPIKFTVTQDNKITSTDDRTCVTLEGTDTDALTITLKNEKPDAEKTVSDAKDANAGIGSTVSYKITVDVPENITELKTFTLTDTPSNLHDDSSTIAIAGLTKGNEYTVSEDGEGANGFTISFDTSKMGSVAGKRITVTYDAVVLAGAASAGKAENSVDLTYSNKIHPDSTTPDGDSDKNHIEDSAVVYTYKIDVTKYKDSATTGNELGAVEFELYQGDATTPLSVVKIADGEYRLAIAGETGATTTLVTASTGKMVVTGLNSGTYYLKETKTVEGYNLLKDKVEVDLNLDTVTEWKEGKDFVQNSDGSWILVKHDYESTTYKAGEAEVTGNYVSQNIINKKGFDLPQTGGLGTLMFILIGGVLIAGGVCLITVPNKKRAA